MKLYLPITANEVAKVLDIADCEDITGESIAKEMLSGVIRFDIMELRRIAAYKDVSLDFLIHNDPSFTCLKLDS